MSSSSIKNKSTSRSKQEKGRIAAEETQKQQQKEEKEIHALHSNLEKSDLHKLTAMSSASIITTAKLHSIRDISSDTYNRIKKEFVETRRAEIAELKADDFEMHLQFFLKLYTEIFLEILNRPKLRELFPGTTPDTLMEFQDKNTNKMRILVIALNGCHWFAMDILKYPKLEFKHILRDLFPLLSKILRNTEQNEIIKYFLLEKTSGGIILNRDRTHMLLTVSIDQIDFDIEGQRYSLPKGRVEPDEDVMTAALAEIEEETKTNLREYEPKFSFQMEKPQFEKGHQFGMRESHFFVFEDVDIDVDNINEKLLEESKDRIKYCVEVLRLEWVPIKTILGGRFNLKYKTLFPTIRKFVEKAKDHGMVVIT